MFLTSCAIVEGLKCITVLYSWPDEAREGGRNTACVLHETEKDRILSPEIVDLYLVPLLVFVVVYKPRILICAE